MKRRVMAALMAALQLWSMSAPALASAEEAWLRLVVHRPGLVTIDGAPGLDLRSTGAAPIPWSNWSMTFVPVAPGRHRITLEPTDPGLTLPRDAVDVEVAAGDTALVRLGRLCFQTSPPGARVLIGTRDAGTAPLWLDPSRVAGGRLFVEAAGFQRQTLEGDTVLAVARETGGYRLELNPLAPQALPVVLADPSHSYWTRHRGPLLIGSTVLLAGGIGAGFAFKNVADDRYDAYRRAGSRDRQRRLFDEAQRYDRLSLVGWGVGEVAFLTTFFLLIRQEPRGLVPTTTFEPLGAERAPAMTLRWSHGF